MWRPTAQALASTLVLSVAIASYWNSAGGEFVFDDSEAILDNGDVSGATDVWSLLEHDFWGEPMSSKTSHKSYRPITVLTFRWNRWLAGGLHPRGFHVTNIILHGLCSVLFYAAARLILQGAGSEQWHDNGSGGSSSSDSSDVAAGHAQRIEQQPRAGRRLRYGGGTDAACLWSALLFASHPVHSESVAGVVGRADLLSSAFFFTAILSFARACPRPVPHPPAVKSTAQQLSSPSSHHLATSDHPPQPAASVGRHRSSGGRQNGTTPAAATEALCPSLRRQLPFMLISLLLTAMSMLCKEQGITALGIFFVFDLLRSTAEPPRQIIQVLIHGRADLKRDHLLARLSQNGFFLRQLAVAVTGIVCILARWQVMAGQPPTFQLMDNPASFSNSSLTRTLSYNYLYALNAWLLLCPVWLCFDWAMGCVPLLQSAGDARCLAVLLLWTTLLALVWSCLRHQENGVHDAGPGRSRLAAQQQQRQQCAVTLSLALIVIPFLPASNLFFRVGFVMAERVLYLPSAGFCILVALGCRHLFNILRRHCRALLPVIPAAALVTVVVFAARASERSYLWRREESLFSAGVDVCPLNAKVHYNVGKVNADAGRADKALAAYREAVRLHPTYDQALNNLGNLLKERGQTREAHGMLERAVQANPDFAAAWMNLAIAKADLNMAQDAEWCYLEALRHRRKYPDAWYNLGNLYLQQKLYANATHAWRRAIELKATHHGAWHNLALMYEETERLQEARQVLTEAVRKLPDSHDLHLTLGNVYGKLGLHSDSEKAFRAAIALTSRRDQQASAWANLGVLHHRGKEYEKAEVAYRTAEQLHPGQTSARQNLDMLLKGRKR